MRICFTSAGLFAKNPG